VSLSEVYPSVGERLKGGACLQPQQQCMKQVPCFLKGKVSRSKVKLLRGCVTEGGACLQQPQQQCNVPKRQ
jgi:hypothetical protein